MGLICSQIGRLWLRLPLPGRRRVARLLFLWRVLADVKLRSLVVANLNIAYQTFNEETRSTLERDYCLAYADAWMDNWVAFRGGPGVVRMMTQIEGSGLLSIPGPPAILACAHFQDVYLALLRVAMEATGAVIYRVPKNLSVKRRLLRQIAVFADIEMIGTQNCIRPALRALNAGRPLVILADQPDDLRGAVGMPFVDGGIAWSPAISYLVERTGARVLWMDIAQDDSGRYLVKLSPLSALPCVTSRDVFAGLTRRLEQAVSARPERYRWDRGTLLRRAVPAG